MKKFLLLFLCTATLFSACEKNNSDKKITETSPAEVTSIAETTQTENIAPDPDYEYYINYDNTAASKKYLGQETKVTIPENIEGHTVIACRPGAFSYTDVTEITFSSELKAFSGIYDAHSLETVKRNRQRISMKTLRG